MPALLAPDGMSVLEKAGKGAPLPTTPHSIRPVVLVRVPTQAPQPDATPVVAAVAHHTPSVPLLGLARRPRRVAMHEPAGQAVSCHPDCALAPRLSHPLDPLAQHDPRVTIEVVHLHLQTGRQVLWLAQDRTPSLRTRLPQSSVRPQSNAWPSQHVLTARILTVHTVEGPGQQYGNGPLAIILGFSVVPADIPNLSA